MKIKRFITIVLSCFMIVLSLGLTACGGSDGGLTIRFYNGGFGREWLDKAADDFSKQHNVKVTLIPSGEYDVGATTLLKSGKNLPDIFIASSAQWRSWVSLGYIEDLTDVYEAYTSCTDTSLEGYSAENGGQIKIKDYLDQRFVDYPYMQKKVGQGDFKPWILQWSVQPTGFAYNLDILEATVHNDKNGTVDGLANGSTWTVQPRTYSDLLTYFADVRDGIASKTYGVDGQGNSKVIAPFGWSGVNANSLFSSLKTWWAEKQGIETSNYVGEGSYFDFFNYGNTASDPTQQQEVSSKVFAQTGLVEAHKLLQGAIVKDGEYFNSDPSATSLSAVDVQFNFVSGKYAVMPAASYLEYEERDFLDMNGDGVNDVDFIFDTIPNVDGYNGNDVIGLKIEDCMYIPSGAKNKDLAKQFLVFLCNEENNEFFTKVTGSIKPFQYNVFEKYPHYDWTKFTLSVFNKYYSPSVTAIYPYPKTTPNEAISNIYRFKFMDFIADTNVSTWLLNLKSETAENIMSGIKDSVDRNLFTIADYYDMLIVD
ncbi:MAG: extracellular solute-binding protein [Clostridiales bacterium]|nr:extracellular solute-binding protein [Clostridiales bacterium]